MSAAPQYWYWNNVLNLKEIKKINKFIINNYNELEKDKLKAKYASGSLKKETTTFLITYSKIQKYIQHLVTKCYRVNRCFFNYDLWDFEKENSCNYNIYKSENKSHYDWHIDATPDPYTDMKLSVIINLSEKEFEGGDFLLDYGEVINVPELKKIGSMIMFKSFLKHQVTPVTNGERRNLTLFLYGPAFK